VKFPLTQFRQFCDHLVIDSKEFGQVTLSKRLGTQDYAIKEIVTGLEEDIHFFDILKGRQQGITTITLALDLFWAYKHPGMQATLAADSEENRDMFRSTLTMYHDGLPKQMRRALVANNRNFITFANRSRIFMQIGGGVQQKKKGGKGRGKGIIYIHATETSSWEDEESLASILASLAQINPERLAIFESTARGFNLREEMWRTAERAVTKRAVFIGWWRNHLYSKHRNSNEYRVYWDGKLTPAEREWVRDIKLLYGYEITGEQMAWWRWMQNEEITDENMLLQEHPPTAEYAFILTGKNFFSMPALTEMRKVITDTEPDPKFYKFKFGDEFRDTEVDETIEALADLMIWEEPDDQGYYSIGADPAYGSSDWADRFVIEIFRCYADRFEQVAEFCSPNMNTYRYAWVLCYLAGAYKNSAVNLEMNGPGAAVLSEMNALRTRASLGIERDAKGLGDVLAHMSYYLYRRLDSPMGGGFVYHWKTTQDTKERMLNNYKDLMERGEGRIHSAALCDEMKIIVRDDGFLGASGRGKDDRVISAGLAAVQYCDVLKTNLSAMKLTWAKELARRERRQEVGRDPTAQETAIGRSVAGYLQKIGMKAPQ
jgi:hypothetical protein